MSYSSGNIIQLDDSFIFRCYICNKIIDSDEPTSKDHVIPQTLFNNEKTNRPTIRVHVLCNSTDKSKDDHWFSRMVFYRSILNPVALEKFNRFIESTERSRTNHTEKIRPNLSDEKLLRTILETKYETGFLENETREKKYIEMLARGLIIRNSWHIKCDVVKVLSVHRSVHTKKQNKKLDEYIKITFLNELDSCMYQFWDEDLMYAINAKENVLYLEFYGQQTYIIGFDYELPSIVSAKVHVTDEWIQETRKSIDAHNPLWLRN